MAATSRGGRDDAIGGSVVCKPLGPLHSSVGLAAGGAAHVAAAAAKGGLASRGSAATADAGAGAPLEAEHELEAGGERKARPEKMARDEGEAKKEEGGAKSDQGAEQGDTAAAKQTGGARQCSAAADLTSCSPAVPESAFVVLLFFLGRDVDVPAAVAAASFAQKASPGHSLCFGSPRRHR